MTDQKGADVMIQNVLGMLAGMSMIGAAIVLVLAVIAVFTGITTHNLFSMLALASVFGAIASGLQWVLQRITSYSENKPTYPGSSPQRVVPDGKQNIQFDPWTDEWYGSGPWWKKW